MIELAELHSLPYDTLWKRYQRGDRGNHLLRPVAVTSRQVHYKGEHMSLPKAAQLAGLKPGTVYRRLQLGWSIERALATPLVAKFFSLQAQRRQ